MVSIGEYVRQAFFNYADITLLLLIGIVGFLAALRVLKSRKWGSKNIVKTTLAYFVLLLISYVVVFFLLFAFFGLEIGGTLSGLSAIIVLVLIAIPILLNTHRTQEKIAEKTLTREDAEKIIERRKLIGVEKEELIKKKRYLQEIARFKAIDHLVDIVKENKTITFETARKTLGVSDNLMNDFVHALAERNIIYVEHKLMGKPVIRIGKMEYEPLKEKVYISLIRGDIERKRIEAMMRGETETARPQARKRRKREDLEKENEEVKGIVGEITAARRERYKAKKEEGPVERKVKEAAPREEVDKVLNELVESKRQRYQKKKESEGNGAPKDVPAPVKTDTDENKETAPDKTGEKPAE